MGHLETRAYILLKISSLSGQEFLGENPEVADEDSVSGYQW